MAATHARPYDLVLVGATGLVGRLTAQHLARYAPRDLRVALAGRSEERLAAVRSELGGTAASWPLVVVDVTDEAAVAELAAATRVVITTVGPYLRYGMALARACADVGTAYADLTGEALFVRQTIDALHERAGASGARIVHACGFDSVPSDLAVGLTAVRAEADSAGTLTDTVLHVRSVRGGIGGSTIDSLRQQLIKTSGDPQTRALLGRADALVDRPSSTRTRSAGRVRAIEREAGGGWQAPFVMGVFNRQIVLRSDALQGRRYGVGFRYREVVDTGSGPRGVLGATALSLGTAALVGAMGFRPARALLDRVLPEPGAGPSQAVLARGRFRFELVATTSTGARYRTVVGADLDPGYHGTAVMLGESGLSLALDDLPTRGGVLTPMTAMGQALAARLRAHEFTVSTDRIEGAPD